MKPDHCVHSCRGRVHRRGGAAALGLAVILIIFFGLGSAYRAVEKTESVRLTVSVSPTVQAVPVSGRILLLLSRTGRFQPRVNGTPIFGLNVDDLQPGQRVTVDDRAFGHPVRYLSEIPEGEYFAQAWLNVYTTFERSDGKTVKLHMDQGEGQNWRRSPGNLYSQTVKVRLGGGADNPDLVLDQVLPPIPPYEDTAYLKHVRIQSRLLSEFWGRPMFLGANVLLPKGYDEHPDVRFPVHYIQGHFPRGNVARFREDPNNAAYKLWAVENAPRFIQVTFEHACPYYDDSYGVNSENVGPYGDAIVTELIPYIEANFRAIGRPWARLLSGGSTGGWVSLAMQVYYPDVFGGTWSFFPDPVDFRKYQIVNLYEDANAYYVETDWTRVPRGACRDTSGNLVFTQEQENFHEEAVGDRFRSGGQWAIWNAVFAPVAADGYPKPLWDPVTGVIDKDAVAWAGERYDLRRYLEKNWPTVGAKLAGKIRVYCGRMDNFYLNEACYLLQESLEKMTDPPYGGEFRYGDRGGHGWTPFQGDEMLRAMAEHVLANSPDKKKDWIY
jgi:S-formylglutathione hydrolase FrmB